MECPLIPIQPQPEPAAFSQKVRDPGNAFLRDVPQPTTREWKNRAYWQRVLPDLYQIYAGICAYSAQWIPLTTSNPTVDHFIPKSAKPQLAYEWSNYRLASLKFNQRKGTHQDVLDPFTLEPDWFILDFPSLYVKPNPILSSSSTKQVIATINRLKLNKESDTESRLRWIRDFCDEHIDFNFLKRNAPFIAYELQRQDLVDKIKSIIRT